MNKRKRVVSIGCPTSLTTTVYYLSAPCAVRYTTCSVYTFTGKTSNVCLVIFVVTQSYTGWPTSLSTSSTQCRKKIHFSSLKRTFVAAGKTQLFRLLTEHSQWSGDCLDQCRYLSAKLATYFENGHIGSVGRIKASTWWTRRMLT
jgi:hypothetical protein